MLTFVFVVLSFILFAAVIGAVIWHVGSEFKTRLDKQVRLARVRNKKQTEAIAAAVNEFRSGLESVKVDILNMPGGKKDGAFNRATASLLSRTEDRYIEDEIRAKRVSVEGIPDKGKAA